MKQRIKETDIRDFEKYANKLAEINQRIQQYNPNAHIYCRIDSLELHENCNYINDREDTGVAQVYISGMDCGEI